MKFHSGPKWAHEFVFVQNGLTQLSTTMSGGGGVTEKIAPKINIYSSQNCNENSEIRALRSTLVELQVDLLVELLDLKGVPFLFFFPVP